MSKNKKKIYKPRPISGFPEYLPEVRMVEQQWLDHIRRVFESYGYCSIETPSVEELDVLHAKGEDVDKEIYVIERLHEDDDDKEARLALHFDQTVPFARYTAQHFNELTFPFKRYQMQRVWRGERPQAGRFREFKQCDIDVINVDNLPLHFDAEMPAIMWEILSSLPGMGKENIRIRISNRKVLAGLLDGLGVKNVPPVVSAIDKFEKNGVDYIVNSLIMPHLTETEGMDKAQAKLCVEKITAFVQTKDIYNIEPISDLMKEGLDELRFVMDQLSHLPEGAAVADLSIVRGLDYYTGTVYETVFIEDPLYGSICSGGRYEDLAGGYINKHLPGVGISIGFSRLFDRLLQQNKLPVAGQSPAQVLVVMPSEERRGDANAAAQALRSRGIKVESFHGGKLKKQLSYAEKKGIPYVWFPPFEEGQGHEVKNMQSGDQVIADPNNWSPESK